MHDPAVASLKDACACCARAFAYIKRVDLTRLESSDSKSEKQHKKIQKKGRAFWERNKFFFFFFNFRKKNANDSWVDSSINPTKESPTFGCVCVFERVLLLLLCNSQKEEITKRNSRRVFYVSVNIRKYK